MSGISRRPCARRERIVVYVDADACPVKEEAYIVAGRHERRLVLVANAPLYVPPPFSVELIVVGKEPDAADDWIVENVASGDVVITGDIPLAARCLELGARVLGPQGREFTLDSIGDALASRDLNASLREVGIAASAPRPFSDRDRSKFRAQLDLLLRPR